MPSSRRSNEKKVPKVQTSKTVVAPILRVNQTTKPTLSYSDMLKRGPPPKQTNEQIRQTLQQSTHAIQQALDEGLSWGDLMTDSKPVVQVAPKPQVVSKELPVVSKELPVIPKELPVFPKKQLQNDIPTITLSTTSSRHTSMNDRIQALKECEDVKMLILERDRFASEASRVSMKRLEYNKELYRRFYSRAFKKWEELDEKANRCILELADFGASHAGYYVLILNNSFEAYCLTSEVSSARTCALAMQNRYDFPFVVVIGRVGPDGKAVFVECLNSQTKSLTVVRPAFMEPLPSSPHKESVGFQVTSIPEEQPQVVEEPVLAVEEPIYEEPILSQPLYIPVYPTNMLSPIDSTIAYILEFIQSLQAQIHSLQTMVATLCGGIIAQEHTPRLCMRRRSRSKSNKCKSPTSEHE